VDFSLSDEQRMMQDSLVRLLQRSYAFDHRWKYEAATPGWSREIWAQFAEIGLLALPFTSENGGLDGTPVDTMIVMEQLGRHITLEPYLSTIVMAGGILRRAASTEQHESISTKVIDGSLIVSLAHTERGTFGSPSRVGTQAVRSGDLWQISGHKSCVLHGGSADLLIISARTSGALSDAKGITLFAVDPRATNINIQSYALHDGQRASDIQINSVLVPHSALIGCVDDGFRILQSAEYETLAAVCAEAVGVMSELHQMTVDYLKQRKQFGVPIGNFQALQHRAADMYIALEQARSMAMYAAMMSQTDDKTAIAQAVSSAKVQIGRSAKLIGEEAVQMFGGIGVTMEFKAGHYFKKLTLLEQFLGHADHHLELLTSGPGLFELE
jgi:alkylation response protein AidB-like acyl-CoA dehydrogenase